MYLLWDEKSDDITYQLPPSLICKSCSASLMTDACTELARSAVQCITHKQ